MENNLKNESNNKNTILVNLSDMLQYSETQWVTDCYECGYEHWFNLPQNNDKCECECGSILIIISNSN